MRLFEIFEDGQRLEQLEIAVDQGRHHHLRIDRAVFDGELVAFFEVQKSVLPRDALQVQRDAHAETRLRAVIGVELHFSSSVGRGRSAGRHKWWAPVFTQVRRWLNLLLRLRDEAHRRASADWLYRPSAAAPAGLENGPPNTAQRQ